MIATEFYNGAGLGNQLWGYAVLRTIAANKNFVFGIEGKEQFKGKDFLDINFGHPVENIKYHYTEKLVRNEFVIDVSPTDNDLLRIQDHTKIYGNMQAVHYIHHRKDQLSEWIKVKKDKVILDYSADDTCIMHLRGGDYVNSPANSLLPLSYYLNGMEYMRLLGVTKFYVVTDDIKLAHSYFDGVAEIIGSSPSNIPDAHKASHHIGGDIAVDYAILNSAKNVILSNSTFGWWATWTNLKVKNVLAPLYWFSYNWKENFWSTGDMYTPGWKYLDRDGHIE